MAIPTYFAAGAVGASAGAPTPGLPASIAADDILLMIVESSVPGTITPPAGWAHVTGAPLQAGFDNRGTLIWKRAVGGDATALNDSGDHTIGRIIAIRGCITTGDPWSGTPGSGTAARASTQTIPATTSTDADCLVVLAIATDVPDSTGTAAFSNWTNGSLASLTERTDNHTNAGDGGAIGFATGELASAGSSGTTSVDVSASATAVMYSVAMKPPAGAAAPVRLLGTLGVGV
jgi:hypothetical protein